MAQSIEQAYNFLPEILETIFSFIEPSAQFVLAPVCWQWYEILKDMRNRRGEEKWTTWIGSVYCRPEMVLWAKAYDPMIGMTRDETNMTMIGGNLNMCKRIIDTFNYDMIRENFYCFIQICIKYNYVEIARMILERHEKECEHKYEHLAIKEWVHSPSERLRLDHRMVMVIKNNTCLISNEMFELIFCDYFVELSTIRCQKFVQNGLPLEMIQKYILSVTSKINAPHLENETWRNALKGICIRERTTLADFVRCVELCGIEIIPPICIRNIIINDHTHLLKWIFSTGYEVDAIVYNVFMWETIHCLNLCAENGRIKMAQIFRNNEYEYPSDVIITALRNNHFEFVDFVLSDGCILNPPEILNGLLWRINEDSLNVFKYLDEICTARGMSLNLTSDMMISIIENTERNGLYLLDFLKWLVKKGVSVPLNLHDIVMDHDNAPELVLFCLEHGAEPTKRMAHHAAYRGNIELMEKVISVLEEKDPIYLAISTRVGNVDMTAWLRQNEWIEPNEKHIADDILDEQYGFFSRDGY